MSKMSIFLISLVVLAIAGLVTASKSFTIVQPKHFGVKVDLGEISPDVLSPGLHWQRPFVSQISSYNNNTIILEENVGEGRNTKDQNSYSAAMRLHYNIEPNAGILAFHLADMQEEDGKALLTGQMSKSLNAVVGQRTTAEMLISPEATLKAFLDQLEWRLKQNNIAIKIDTVEMLTQYVGSQDALRLPMQLRIKPGQDVESMAGPSVPVQHLQLVEVPLPKAATTTSVSK